MSQYVERTIPLHQKRKWTKEDDDYLLANPDAWAISLVPVLNRTVNSITARRATLRKEGRTGDTQTQT